MILLNKKLINNRLIKLNIIKSHIFQLILIWYSPLVVKYLTQGEDLYPERSTIFKYLTWNPETVKYGISNCTLIGCFLNFCLFGETIVGNLNYAFNKNYLC